MSTMTVTDLLTSDGNDGSDTLFGIETLRFGDGIELTIADETSSLNMKVRMLIPTCLDQSK